MSLILFFGLWGRFRSCWELRLALCRCRKWVFVAILLGYVLGGRIFSRLVFFGRFGSESVVLEL